MQSLLNARAPARRLRGAFTLLLIAAFAAPVFATPALAKGQKGGSHHATPGAVPSAAPAKEAPQQAAPAEAPKTEAAKPEANKPEATKADTPAAAPASPEPQTEAAQSTDPRVTEINAALSAGLATGVKGPGKASLGDQADLGLGPDQVFVPAAQSMRILRAFGNSPDADGLMGLVMSTKNDEDWIVVVRHIKEGYVKDDDAKNWSADELLKGMREGAEESNEDRRERGFPEIEIVGWIEKPTYDAASKRLVWSILSKQKGESDAEAQGVNYNTFALGRDGYFSLNLLTDAHSVEANKPVAKGLLANLNYRPGKRYTDFNASTDQIAAYGLAALVGGVAAKKLGLVALGAAFFAKFAKLTLVGLAAAGAGVAKLFKKNSAA